MCNSILQLSRDRTFRKSYFMNINCLTCTKSLQSKNVNMTIKVLVKCKQVYFTTITPDVIFPPAIPLRTRLASPAYKSAKTQTAAHGTHMVRSLPLGHVLNRLLIVIRPLFLPTCWHYLYRCWKDMAIGQVTVIALQCKEIHSGVMVCNRAQ